MAVRGKSPITVMEPRAVDVPWATEGTSALDSAPLEGTIEPLDLVKIEPANALELFTVSGALTPILERLAQEVRSIILDPGTPQGREAIKSLAFKVGKAKNYIEEQKVALNRKLKEQPKLVDANGKAAWDFLERLQKDTRKPLTDWEAEQERLEAARVEAERQAALALEIANSHEFAILLDRQITAEKEAARLAKIEADRLAQERIQEEAERKAQEAAKAELEAAARREQEAKDRAEKAEADRIAAEARAAQMRQENLERAARERELADQRVAKAAQEATEREHARQLAAQKAEEEATAARTKDKEHRATFNSEALTDLMKMTGMNEDAAKKVIVAIAMGRVRHIRIEY